MKITKAIQSVMILIVVSALILLIQCCGTGGGGGGGSTPPESAPVPRVVTVSDKTVFIDGVALQAPTPGVIFVPTPFCENPGSDTLSVPEIYIPLLDKAVQLGARILRIPNLGLSAKEFLRESEKLGLLVIAGFYMHASAGIDYTDPDLQAEILADFEVFVKTYRNEPALLWYEIGNDLNIQFAIQGRKPEQLPAAMDLIDRMAARAAELDPNHPSATAFGEISDLGDPALGTDDNSLSHLAIIGVNTFRGATFNTLLEDFHNKSNKAFWISEWGFDRYDRNRSVINEDYASGALATLWAELLYDGTAVVATVMELTDSAWKIGAICSQDPGGYQPVNSAVQIDEDFMGLLMGDPADPEGLEESRGYEVLQQLWTNPLIPGTVTTASGNMYLPDDSDLVFLEDFVTGEFTADAADPGAAVFSIIQPLATGNFYPQAYPHRLYRAQSLLTVQSFFCCQAGDQFNVYIILSKNAGLTDTLLNIAQQGAYFTDWPQEVVILDGPVVVERQ